MTLFLLWIGTYCIICVLQQTSGVKDLPSLVRYDDSSLAAIRHVQSIIPLVRPRPNIRSHSVLFLIIILARNIDCKSILQKTLKQFGLVASKYERKSRYKSNFQCVSLCRGVCLCRAMCFSKVRFSLAFYRRHLAFFPCILA